MDNTLLFHDKIIKTGKGESKFAVRYNKGCFSPYRFTLWNYEAKSVSIPIVVDNDLNQGIFCIELEDFLRRNQNPYAKRMWLDTWWEPLTFILLEYTDDDVLFKSEAETALRQCNIVYVCSHPLSIHKFYKMGINRFLKEKEKAEYNTYF